MINSTFVSRFFKINLNTRPISFFDIFDTPQISEKIDLQYKAIQISYVLIKRIHTMNRNITFERPRNPLLSAGNVQTSWSNGIITTTFQTFPFVYLFEKSICTILKSQNTMNIQLMSNHKRWLVNLLVSCEGDLSVPPSDQFLWMHWSKLCLNWIPGERKVRNKTSKY